MPLYLISGTDITLFSITIILKSIVNILKYEHEYSIEEKIITKSYESYAISNNLFNQGLISKLLLEYISLKTIPSELSIS